MNFDEINDLATTFGVYQIFLLITIWWGNIVMVCNVVFMVFGAADKTTCSNLTWVDETHYAHNGPKNLLQTNLTSLCTNNEYVFHSVVPDYGIEGNTWITPLMTSVQLAGALVGSLLGGQIADIYGRRLNTWFWILGMVVFTSLSIFAKNWPVMSAFRFFIGISTGGYLSSAVILVMEWMNEKTRLPIQLSFDMIQSVGFIWLSILAYLTRDWKQLSLIMGLQGIPLIILFFFILDPPIWLFQKRKMDRLTVCMKRIGNLNRKTELKEISKSFYEDLEPPHHEHPERSTVIKSTYLALFSSRKLIQYSFMNIYSFFITGTIAYLLIFNVGNLVGNIFLNFALLGTVNIGSAAITMVAQHVLKLGRRPIHQTALNGVWMSLTVIILLYLFGLEVKASGVLTAAALIGSMFSFPLWPICNLYSGELYPTHMRNMGNGIGGFSANLGGILAPQILSLFDLWKPSPFIIGVFLTLLNAVLAFFFLPETRGKFQENSETSSETDSNLETNEETLINKGI